MAGDGPAMVGVLQQAYRLWEESKGESVETWMALVDEDVVFGSVADEGAGPDPTRRGKEAIREYFAALNDGWEMNFYRVDEFVAQDDRVVMIGRTSWTSRLTGRIADTPKIDVWWFRDRRAVRFYEMFDTAAMLAAMMDDEAAPRPALP
jgi:uncharacterized protein